MEAERERKGIEIMTTKKYRKSARENCATNARHTGEVATFVNKRIFVNKQKIAPKHGGRLKLLTTCLKQ